MKPSNNLQERYRAIPSVQTMLQDPALRSFSIEHRLVKTIVQEEIEKLRAAIGQKKYAVTTRIPDHLRRQVVTRLTRLTSPGMQRVINATGIILHTNMGRAPLAAAALKAIENTANHYNNVELDLRDGKRGNRLDHVEALLCLLTGAEAALVVNNCAAAIFLAIHTFCRRKEVPVSRGELVEIGGSFRMPEVMKSGGAKMVEIGTSNKTHLDDYREAITSRTGALLKVHTSNYRVLGFTKSVGIGELAELAHDHHLPLIYDMGSGVLRDLQEWGYPYEPLAGDMIEAGADVVTFSGDKLLGGPQAGIIIGRKAMIAKIRKNHLTRALRCDKLVYAALEATLRLYLDPATLTSELPVARMLTRSVAALRDSAATIVKPLSDTALHIDIVDAVSQMGSGALPLEQIPSVALRIRSEQQSAATLAAALRKWQPPIVGHIQDDAVMLNLRTLRDDELTIVSQALKAIGSQR